jgi:hypothetical protein
MDHFTNEIIRTLLVFWIKTVSADARVGQELAAISATSSPDPKNWVFSSVNNRFINPHGSGARNSTPEEWVGRGMGHLQAALSGHDEGR